jgi:O-antigen ligase
MLPAYWAQAIGVVGIFVVALVLAGRGVRGLYNSRSARSTCLCLLLLSIAWSIPMVAHVSEGGREAWVRVAGSAASGFVAAMCLIVLGAVGRSVAAAVIVGGLAVTAVIIVAYADRFVVTEWSDVIERRDAEIASPVSLGLLCAMGLGAGAALMRWHWFWGLACIVIALGSSAVLLQRFNFVIAPFVLILFVGWGRGMVAVGVTLGVLALLGVYAPATHKGLGLLFEHLEALAGGHGVNSRLDLLDQGLEAFVAHPLLGVGTDSWAEGRYPHSFLMQSFSDLGLFGGAAAIALALVTGIATWSCARRGRRGAASEAMVVGAACCGWLCSLKSGDLSGASLLIPLTFSAWGAFLDNRGVGRRSASPTLLVLAREPRKQSRVP